MTPKIAVQLYSVREEMSDDLPGVLARLAEMGYIGVEAYRGMDYQTAARVSKEHGLQVMASHLSAPRGEDAAETFEIAQTYGIEQIIVPWLPPERFTSEASVLEICDELNEANRIANERGYTLGYHNHDFEFNAIGDGQAIDIMIENLDPAVFFEIDTYWAEVGGRDPNALLRQLGPRVPMIHVKDGPLVNGEPMVALGQGKMDIHALAEAASAEWFVVELDECATDMMEAIAQSYTYLTGEGLARGNR